MVLGRTTTWAALTASGVFMSMAGPASASSTTSLKTWRVTCLSAKARHIR